MSKPKIKNADDRMKFFEQAAGYLAYCNDAGTTAPAILATLTHDICGLARQEECFLPRVSRYAKYWKG
ncbi:hypothetical protein KAR91_20955 [Candidatus Pacearchaeota archaeon]|nr:hypothetical protein [Candidatus Pacearchaeota archaeon]